MTNAPAPEYFRETTVEQIARHEDVVRLILVGLKHRNIAKGFRAFRTGDVCFDERMLKAMGYEDWDRRELLTYCAVFGTYLSKYRTTLRIEHVRYADNDNEGSYWRFI
jgi:hypothetical protein